MSYLGPQNQEYRAEYTNRISASSKQVMRKNHPPPRTDKLK